MRRATTRTTGVRLCATPRATPRSTPRTTPVRLVRAISPIPPMGFRPPIGSAGKPMTTCGHVGGVTFRQHRTIYGGFQRASDRALKLANNLSNITSKGSPQ
jgi:hypothetical protein